MGHKHRRGALSHVLLSASPVASACVRRHVGPRSLCGASLVYSLHDGATDAPSRFFAYLAELFCTRPLGCIAASFCLETDGVCRAAIAAACRSLLALRLSVEYVAGSFCACKPTAFSKQR